MRRPTGGGLRTDDARGRAGTGGHHLGRATLPQTGVAAGDGMGSCSCGSRQLPPRHPPPHRCGSFKEPRSRGAGPAPEAPLETSILDLRGTVRLFLVARSIGPQMHFLLLTQTPSVVTERLSRSRRQRRGFFSQDRATSVKTVQPRDVPGHLQAADFAISLIKPAPSKVSSSPTKVREYLASGLPILANRGIGDVDAIIERHRVEVLIEDFRDPTYRKAVTSILAQVERDPGPETRRRRAAEEELSLNTVGVPRYLDVYRRLGLGERQQTPKRL